MSLVEARSVGRVFPPPEGSAQAQVVALDEVDVAIDAGEMVVVTGASGSGKSTLLACLGGLDPPSTGEVLFEGESLYGRSARALTLLRARAIGFVFQDFGLIAHLSALENVALPQLFAEGPEGGGEPRRLLERFGMGHRLAHKPDALSRGEMQRVALARALVNRPRLLLADEPTANLDAANAESFLEELSGLVRDDGLTVVLASHRVEGLGASRRVLRLEAGRVVADERS